METGTYISRPHLKIGDSASDVVLALAQVEERLESLSFTIYTPRPGVPERFRDNQKSAGATIAGWLNHDNRANKHWKVPVEELSSDILKNKIQSLRAEEALALDCKCVFRDASVRYLQMVDITPQAQHHTPELLKAFLAQLLGRGVIVDSGGSYHFYGFQFLDYDQWIRFMGRCLLAPWSDSRWVGHSLIEGGGALRISASQLKPMVPSVCELVRAGPE